jgi:hypothetical protein
MLTSVAPRKNLEFLDQCAVNGKEGWWKLQAWEVKETEDL